MSDLTNLEKEVLDLPPKERERLVLAAWESLETGPVTLANSTIDPEGIKIAVHRDKEIESGSVQTISHSEFMRRTSGV